MHSLTAVPAEIKKKPSHQEFTDKRLEIRRDTMGLDMYLSGIRYLRCGENSDQQLAAEIRKVLPELAGADVEQVRAEFMHWRKAYHIDNWFMENTDPRLENSRDDEFPIRIEKLYELQDLCKAVLASPDQAETLLPSDGPGSFGEAFEYDNLYFYNVNFTLKWLNDFLSKEGSTNLKQWALFYRRDQ